MENTQTLSNENGAKLIVCYPHGMVFPLGVLSSIPYLISNGIISNPKLAAMPILAKIIGFLRHFAPEGSFPLEVIPASKSCLLKNLREGRDVILFPGGAAESSLAHNKTLCLVTEGREGYRKIAEKTGATIIPVLSLGENDVWKKLWKSPIPGVEFCVQCVNGVFRTTIGNAFPLFWPIPQPVSVHVIVGNKIVATPDAHDKVKESLKKMHQLAKDLDVVSDREKKLTFVPSSQHDVTKSLVGGAVIGGAAVGTAGGIVGGCLGLMASVPTLFLASPILVPLGTAVGGVMGSSFGGAIGGIWCGTKAYQSNQRKRKKK